MIVTLDAKRRISIPAAVAPASPGDQFEVKYDADDDTVTLRRVKRKMNWLDVLQNCPVSMDDLPPRSSDKPRELEL